MEVLIPRNSNSDDKLVIYIKTVKITKKNDKYEAYFPSFIFSPQGIVQKIDNKLLIFDPDPTNKQELPADIFDVELFDLEAYFHFNFVDTKLLTAKRLKLTITKPIDAAHAFDNNERWRFKDLVEIEAIDGLNIDESMGAIDIALGIFKENNKEDSEIYPYLKDIYEKIMMELTIGEIDIEMETLEVNPDDMVEKKKETIQEKREESEEKLDMDDFNS